MPQDVQQVTADGSESKYGFRMTSKDQLNTALDKATAQCPPDVIPETLIRLFQERFPETTLQGIKTDDGTAWVECNLNWRGSIRHGRLNFIRDTNGVFDDPSSIGFDWEVSIEVPTGGSTAENVTYQSSAGSVFGNLTH